MATASESAPLTGSSAMSAGEEEPSPSSPEEDAGRTIAFIVIFFVLAAGMCAVIFYFVVMMKDVDGPVGNATDAPSHAGKGSGGKSPAAGTTAATGVVTVSTEGSTPSVSTTVSQTTTTTTTTKPAPPPPGVTYCGTDDCRHAALVYTQLVSTSRDPCTNFYQYSCSVKRAVGDEMYDNVTREILASLAKPPPTTGPQTAGEKARAFYHTCLGRTANLKDNRKYLVQFFKDNGLTFQEDKTTSPIDTTLVLLLRYDRCILYSLPVTVPEYAGREITLGAERCDTIEKWQQKALTDKPSDYEAHVKSVLTDFGLTDAQTISSTAARIIAAGNAVSKAMEDAKQETVGAYLPVTQLVVDFSIGSSWKDAIIKYSDGFMNDNTRVRCDGPPRSFIQKLFVDISKSDMNVFFAWRTAADLQGIVTEVHSQGLKRDCYLKIEALMKYAVVGFYLYPRVTEKKLDEALAIVKGVQEKLAGKLEKTTWLSDAVRTKLAAKVRAILFQIAFPVHLRTAQEAEAFYASFPEVRESFLKAFLDYTAAHRAKTHERYKRTKTTLLELDFPTLDIGGIYHPNNIIQIKSYALLSPLLNEGAPPEFNYGLFGMVMAHEMAHAVGRIHHDKDEKGQNINWDQPSRDAYLQRGTCEDKSLKTIPNELRRDLVEEYRADILAIRSHYEAYQEAKAKSGGLAVRGMEKFTADQIFFISRCIFFCSNTSVHPDDHHPNYPHRCNVPAAHLPPFAAAFKCPLGSPENPPKKCEFW